MQILVYFYFSLCLQTPHFIIAQFFKGEIATAAIIKRMLTKNRPSVELPGNSSLTLLWEWRRDLWPGKQFPLLRNVALNVISHVLLLFFAVQKLRRHRILRPQLFTVLYFRALSAVRSRITILHNTFT